MYLWISRFPAAQSAAAKRSSLTLDTSAISAISARDRFFCALCASESPARLQRQQFIDLALTIRKRIHPHTDALEQRQVQIRQRCRFRVLDVPPARDARGASAGDQNRKINVIVHVWISDAAYAVGF